MVAQLGSVTVLGINLLRPVSDTPIAPFVAESGSERFDRTGLALPLISWFWKYWSV